MYHVCINHAPTHTCTHTHTHMHTPHTCTHTHTHMHTPHTCTHIYICMYTKLYTLIHYTHRNGLADRLTVLHCAVEDLRLSRLPSATGDQQQLDVIVSNPPYITTHDMAALDPEVAWYERPVHNTYVYIRSGVPDTSVCIYSGVPDTSVYIRLY